MNNQNLRRLALYMLIAVVGTACAPGFRGSSNSELSSAGSAAGPAPAPDPVPAPLPVPAPPPTGACDLNATTANFASQVAAAQSGQVICLASGNYGTWAGTNKNITVTKQAGASVTMALNFNTGDSGFIVDGLTITDATIVNGVKNITIRNSAFTGQVLFDNIANGNILLDGNTHINIDVCGGCGPAAIHLAWSSSTFSGITVQNSLFQGGNADGIQAGTGLNILNNRFVDISEHGRDELHTDAIQLMYAKGAVIRGNYIYNCVDGIVAYSPVENLIIEDNVVDLVNGRFGIELYSDKDSIVRHNSVIYSASCASQFCGQIYLGHKSTDPAGTGTVIENNIASLISINDGSTAAINRNNMLRSGSSGSNFIGTAVYKGGAHPVDYAGFYLSPGSPGAGAAADGLNVGIR